MVAATLLYRQGLAEILSRHERIAVVGTAADAEAGIAILEERAVDVVLLDVGLADDVATLRRIVQAVPGSRVVAFGIAPVEEAVVACAEAGVAGYVSREASLDEVVASLEAVRDGDVVCPPWVAGSLLRRVGALADVAEAQPARPLTAREAEVIALVDEGLSNKDIARRLQIEVPTVKNHVHNILEKVGATRRSEAAARVRAGRASRSSARSWSAV